jgi:polyisoprenyl-phosphate glycosyltransferase
MEPQVLESRVVTEKTLDLTVVVPVYQCADCLSSLCSELVKVCSPLVSDFEIILVDDGSRDGGWDAILAEAKKFAPVRGVKLSRNFGQHMAVTAGIAESRGLKIIVMDCDLQDPPALIGSFLEASQSHEIVFSRRSTRRQPWHRRVFSNLYSKLLSALTGFSVDSEASSFTLISRRVAQEFLRFQDRSRHYLYILRWLGFSHITLEYDQAARFSGKSSYSFRSLVSHAMTGILFQSGRFLSWITYMGLAAALASFGLGILYIVTYFWFTPPPGWTALAVLIVGMGGVTLVCIGVCGLYIGQIFEQVKGRPLYVVDCRTGQR